MKKKQSTKHNKVRKHTTAKTPRPRKHNRPGSWSGLIATNRRLARLRAKAKRAQPAPCQHHRTRVLETRRAHGRYALPGETAKCIVGHYIRRRLQCLDCEARSTEYAPVTDPEQRWRDRRPALGRRY